MPRNLTADAALPSLSQRDFHILLTLVDAECHGYGVVKAIGRRTEGAVELDPANLYRAMQRMIDQKLVEEGGRRVAPDSDRERRYYRITERGRATLAAAAERMRVLVTAAEARQLISRSEGGA